MKEKAILFLFFLAAASAVLAQNDQPVLPAKVSHAEPIYFDLIRDLGARKGERELNVGMGMRSEGNHASHSYLVEYEFAPVNRLGLEIEIPIAFRVAANADPEDNSSNGIEGIKGAMQYSFFVSEKLRTTMAAGYIFERTISTSRPVYTHAPFFIVAKRWGAQFHSMVYAGPQYEYQHGHEATSAALINASVHYVIPQTKNFIGIELNEELSKTLNSVIVRPQMKMTLSPTSALGLSLGIACSGAGKPLDFLIRWIYEPRRK